MTYLTQVSIDKRDALRHQLTDGYRWHQAFWKAFPAPHGTPRPFLSRVDDDGQMCRAYLLSDRIPAVQPWGEWATREIVPNFLEYVHYRFELRANPTVKRVVRNEVGERKKNGRRTAIYKPDQLNEWLQNKARQHGFTILNVEIGGPVTQHFRRKNKHGKHVCVDFRGTLQVQNRDRFKDAFQTGIGPAKAFGFGMIVLQPLG